MEWDPLKHKQGEIERALDEAAKPRIWVARRMSLWERIKRRLSPAYRARRDAETRENIRFLLKHPEIPVVFEPPR